MDSVTEKMINLLFTCLRIIKEQEGEKGSLKV